MFLLLLSFQDCFSRFIRKERRKNKFRSTNLIRRKKNPRPSNRSEIGDEGDPFLLLEKKNPPLQFLTWACFCWWFNESLWFVCLMKGLLCGLWRIYFVMKDFWKWFLLGLTKMNEKDEGEEIHVAGNHNRMPLHFSFPLFFNSTNTLFFCILNVLIFFFLQYFMELDVLGL